MVNKMIISLLYALPMVKDAFRALLSVLELNNIDIASFQYTSIYRQIQYTPSIYLLQKAAENRGLTVNWLHVFVNKFTWIEL